MYRNTVVNNTQRIGKIFVLAFLGNLDGETSHLMEDVRLRVRRRLCRLLDEAGLEGESRGTIGKVAILIWGRSLVWKEMGWSETGNWETYYPDNQVARFLLSLLVQK